MSDFVLRDSQKPEEVLQAEAIASKELPDRLPLTYNNLPLTYFTADDFTFIEIKAKALTLEEIFEYLGIDPLTDSIPPKELSLATKCWKRGRVNGIATAADKLFESMSDKNGGASALAYLKQMSETFKIKQDDLPSTGNFSLKVVLDE